MPQTTKAAALQSIDYIVFDIADEELLKRAVKGARAHKKRGWHERWTAISDVFGLGSTYSMQLCRRFDLDPHEKVRQ